MTELINKFSTQNLKIGFLLLLPFAAQAGANLEDQLKDPSTVDKASQELCDTPTIETYPNGKVAVVRCIKNDIPDGKSYSFYPDGTLKSVGSFHQGQLDGEWTRYYPDSKIQDQGKWSDGKPTGNWQFWNADGTPHHEDDYSDGAILPKVIHSLDLSILAGANYTYGSGNNNYTGCYASAPFQPCIQGSPSSSSGGIGFGTGILLNYHLWRKWSIEVGAFYRGLQSSQTIRLIDANTPPNTASAVQSYNQPLIAFPVMGRFHIGEHFSVGLGAEFRSILPVNYSTQINPISGTLNLSSTPFPYIGSHHPDWGSIVVGVAYRTQLTHQFGLVIDCRTTVDDAQLLVGVSYRLFPKD